MKVGVYNVKSEWEVREREVRERERERGVERRSEKERVSDPVCRLQTLSGGFCSLHCVLPFHLQPGMT